MIYFNYLSLCAFIYLSIRILGSKISDMKNGYISFLYLLLVSAVGGFFLCMFVDGEFFDIKLNIPYPLDIFSVFMAWVVTSIPKYNVLKN